MQNSYVLKNKNNELILFYYGSEKSIYYKKFENGHWGTQTKLIQGVADYFSIDFYKNGEIYLFCQALNGDVILCKEESGFEFGSKIIFKNQSERRNKSIFKALVSEMGMTVMYNMQLDSSRNEHLVKRQIGYERSWSEPESIDSFMPSNLNLFKVQKIKSDHLVIAYKKKERETLLGYRELNQTKVTSFNIFHKTAYQITDHTFLATDKDIHFIYISKNMFSNQIIYRRRNSNGFSAPIVLFEGSKVKSCSIAIIKNRVYAFWVIGNSLYFSVSTDGGENFSNYTRYLTPISPNSKKIEFISFNKMQESEYVLNEFYIDANDFDNIQFLKQECPEFFGNGKSREVLPNDFEKVAQREEQASSSYLKPQSIMQDDFMSNFDESFFESKLKEIQKNKALEEKSESENVVLASSLEVFRPKIALQDEYDQFADLNAFPIVEPTRNTKHKIDFQVNDLKEKLSEKEKQISALNNIIKEKDEQKEEIEKAEQKLIKQLELLKEENQKMKEDTILLKQTIIDEIETPFQKDYGGEEFEQDQI